MTGVLLGEGEAGERCEVVAAVCVVVFSGVMGAETKLAAGEDVAGGWVGGRGERVAGREGFERARGRAAARGSIGPARGFLGSRWAGREAAARARLPRTGGVEWAGGEVARGAVGQVARAADEAGGEVARGGVMKTGGAREGETTGGGARGCNAKYAANLAAAMEVVGGEVVGAGESARRDTRR